jgi:hemin uptake protein HemP
VRPSIRSDQLLAGRRQVAIVHNDEVYFLRQTRLGKLILTK